MIFHSTVWHVAYAEDGRSHQEVACYLQIKYIVYVT